MNANQLIDQFDAHLQASGYSRHTRRAYRCDLKGLARFCRYRRLTVENVRPADLADFLNSPYAQLGPTGHTRALGAINRVRASIRSFFTWLRDTGQISANPAIALRARQPYPKLPEIISKKIENRLMSAMHNADGPLAFRDHVMVEMLLATGMRVSELAALDTEDLDLAAGTATIQTKGGPFQVRHIRKGAARLLARYLRWRRALPQVSPALFVSSAGRRITVRHFSRRLKGWAGRAGIADHLSPHTFRHTLASRLLALTGNLRLVQQALGHRSISSTVRYTHVPSAALKAALESV